MPSDIFGQRKVQPIGCKKTQPPDKGGLCLFQPVIVALFVGTPKMPSESVFAFIRKLKGCDFGNEEEI